MDPRWAAVVGLTVAAAAAIGGAWALRSVRAPDPPPSTASIRTDREASVARSGPATVEGSARPAALPSAAAPTTPVRPPPRFDVVRVERDGSAVIAGRAEPGATVTLMVDGQPVGEAAADANGQFVILPPPFAAGERALSLASKAKDGLASTSAQAVTILGAEQGKRIVALAEPGAPTRILSDAAPAPTGETHIRAVEAEQGGAFYASGTSPPGATVRLYLNGGPVAETKAASDGAWSVRIEKGMVPGAYEVRADQIEASGKVASRAQVTFNYPAQAAPAAVAGAPAAQTLEAGPAGASAEGRPAGTTVAQVRTHQVIRGDSLWRMSAKLYGSGLRYTEIYAANAKQIRNPNLIYPGQTLVAPERP